MECENKRHWVRINTKEIEEIKALLRDIYYEKQLLDFVGDFWCTGGEVDLTWNAQDIHIREYCMSEAGLFNNARYAYTLVIDGVDKTFLDSQGFLSRIYKKCLKEDLQKKGILPPDVELDINVKGLVLGIIGILVFIALIGY